MRRIVSLVLRMSPADWILAGELVALGFYLAAYQRQSSEACAMRPGSAVCGGSGQIE